MVDNGYISKLESNIAANTELTYIGKLEENNTSYLHFKDTVIEELKQKNPDLLKAIYMLAFESYNGF